MDRKDFSEWIDLVSDILVDKIKQRNLQTHKTENKPIPQTIAFSVVKRE